MISYTVSKAKEDWFLCRPASDDSGALAIENANY